MPRKNVKKLYVENGHYHIYNRGVEKRIIFLDDHDYKIFLHLLKFYLDPQFKVDSKTGLFNHKSLADDVDLLAYCLMPNHFHFLVKQYPINGIQKFMRCVMTNYVMYFNKRYERVGPLFEGIYKAILVDKDEYLLQVSRYIHRNPLSFMRVGPSRGSNPIGEYPYSSYGDYLGTRHAVWVKPKQILEYFNKNTQHESYRLFVESDGAEISSELIFP